MIKDCKIFKLFSTVWQRSDGKEATFYQLESNDWVQVVAYTKDKKLIMCSQFRMGVGETSIEFPGGIIEPGEDPADAALRELQEETGYSGTVRYVHTFYANPAYQTNRVYLVIVDNCEKVGGVNFDENESIDTFLVTPEAVVELIENKQIMHSMALASLGVLFCINRQIKD